MLFAGLGGEHLGVSVEAMMWSHVGIFTLGKRE